MNQYELIGRLGADAEVKTLKNNKVLSFRMAVDRSYYDSKKKERVEATEWLRVNKFFDLNSDVKVAQYLTKGTLVYVSGIPKSEAWSDKDGNIQSAISVTGRELVILATAKVESKDDLPY